VVEHDGVTPVWCGGGRAGGGGDSRQIDKDYLPKVAPPVTLHEQNFRPASESSKGPATYEFAESLKNRARGFALFA